MQELGEAFHKTKYCSLLLDFSPLEEISCRKAKCEQGLDMEYFVHRHGIYCKISVQIAGMRHTLKRSNSPDLHIGQLGCCSNRLVYSNLTSYAFLSFSFTDSRLTRCTGLFTFISFSCSPAAIRRRRLKARWAFWPTSWWTVVSFGRTIWA